MDVIHVPNPCWCCEVNVVPRDLHYHAIAILISVIASLRLRSHYVLILTSRWGQKHLLVGRANSIFNVFSSTSSIHILMHFGSKNDMVNDHNFFFFFFFFLMRQITSWSLIKRMAATLQKALCKITSLKLLEINYIDIESINEEDLVCKSNHHN